jgi:CYTH domain-containing protein/predicted ATPase
MKSIVLTGGPCAGKTSALNFLRTYLTSLGYTPFIVPESATAVMQSGILPSNHEPVFFQTAVSLLQLNQEAVAHKLASTLKNPILILDRGILDNKAYCSADEWHQVRKNLKDVLGSTPTDSDLCYRYDLVLHLQTAARTNAYTLTTNTHRKETADEAIALDDRTLHSWLGHHGVKVIPVFPEFHEKCVVMQSCIDQFLGIAPPQEIEYKYLLTEADYTRLCAIINFGCTCTIAQSYLTEPKVRLRKASFNFPNTYEPDQAHCYITTKTQSDNPLQRTEVENEISLAVYNQLVTGLRTTPLCKTRSVGVYKGFKVELDVFSNILQNGKPLRFLEIEVPSLNILPPELGLKDVTADTAFSNFTLWQSLQK